MQNIKTADFQRELSNHGYKPLRTKGSHTIYEAERVIKDSMCVPTADREINGALAQKLTRQMENFSKR